MAAGDHRPSARIAIVGTGYVADLYMPSLRSFPGLEVIGAFDVDPARLAAFTAHWSVPAAPSLAGLIAARPDILLNLTSPSAHAGVSRAALEADVHVWSEKPLALDLAEAEALAGLARSRGLHLASAPCSVLGRAAQTVWAALRDGRIGTPRLAYAELDDGFVAQAPHQRWRSASGAPWPAEHEFATGCTLEHAGYYLSWLMAMFGPVRRIVSGSARLLDASQTGGGHAAPDYASASLHFDAMVARLTCSIVASHDHRLRIFGDGGVLEVDEAWANGAAVRVRRRHVIRRRLFDSPVAWKVPAAGGGHPMVGRRGAASMNFALGVAEMALALAARRPPRLAGDFALHLTEVALAIQAGGEHRPRTAFDPIAPMEWRR
ncbi:Gfo/Idh/MocA family protein [Rhizorhabdus dicambivorans]|uniref:Gfo/Idh/MocA family oxidoreductase n=1 Tax=Rhizorhabdus dicambivorans TaxID=1850238 RepID=A0A2A4FYI0_9SPHN|nr:Gfo/Idh/MocA family oxidoreductase [Rhizorhabdus dicambivorans]ATE63093.1 gfo/Idh/MocA family oxidoreductase [Rhizorhabdus dicambivorans]PCE43270.1 gfo/Idh/MocA family oxidoreductase [Rhizorhabdus dicambivorans]